MKLTIYNQKGTLKATVSPEENSTHAKAIMGDNVLNLSFTLYEFLLLEVNDYIIYQEERFTLLDDYRPEKKSDSEFKYDVKFYGIEAELKKALVLKMVDNDNETSFSLTDTAATHLQLIIDNINRIKPSENWTIGEVVASGNKDITYDCTYCFEGLNKIADTFETEWWIEGKKIHLSRCEHGDPITLGYNNGLQNLTKNDNDQAQFFTRLYPIGSSRNITKDKYGYSRLRLPGGVISVEQNTHLGIVEYSEEEAFQHIYPRRIGKVGTVRSEEVTGEDGDPFTIYYFNDPDLTFNPNDYEIAGQVKNIVFQGTCALSGYDFEVNFDSKTKEFEIITQFPYDNMQLPGGGLIPKSGDEYILYNIDMPVEYYRAAEVELEGAVTEFLEKYSIDVSIYKGQTDYIDLIERNIDLKLGRRVKLESPEYFPTGSRDSRLTAITRKIHNPTEAEIECSYSVAPSRISNIENNIVDIQTAFKEQLNKEELSVLKSWDSADPTEYNVLSAVRTIRTISNSLKKMFEEIEEKFLRKDIPDSAAELITFLNGIEVVGEALIDRLTSENGAIFKDFLSSEKFVSGFPAGSGWAIQLKEIINSVGAKESKAIMEIDEITIRGVLRVYEFIISQLRGENGTTVTSDLMKVASIDKEAKRIYLDTEKGVLYNPFKAGDVIMVQRFGGLEGVENIIKQYEFIVSAAGIGSGGEDRLDWIDYENFTGNLDDVAERDVLTRVDSISDPDRKGIIKQTSVEPGSPYMDIIYGMKTDPEDSVRTRLGRLSGIINYWWGQLKGYGLYSDNVYLMGEFRLRTGDDVRTLFEMVEGMLRSAMQNITYNLTDEDNFLTNAAFIRDMEGWQHDSDINLYSFDDQLLDMGYNFYSEKNTVSEVVQHDGRQMLRLKDGAIKQENKLITQPEEDSILFLSFRYLCEELGTLKIGFDDGDPEGDFYLREVEISAGSGYKTFEISGEWDGLGDFCLSFTGDIYIEQINFSNRPLEDYKREVSTEFIQTHEKIEAIAKDHNTLENYVKEAGWITTADGHKLWATHETVNALTGQLTKHESSFHVTSEKIEGMVSRITDSENKIGTIDKTISSAGWITTADGNKLWATIATVDALGRTVNTHTGSFHVTATQISAINQSIDTINNKINTAGWITTSDGNKIWATQESMNAFTKGYEAWKSEITQTANRLTLSINSGTGKMLYKDPEFSTGVNNTVLYNNAGGTSLLYERVAKSSDLPTGSSYMMKLTFIHGGSTSPGLGGFRWGHSTRANAVYEAHIVAKIPVGYTIKFASNAAGDNRTDTWLSSQEGTGKWETYIHRVRCGSSGTFSTTNFFYIDGLKPTVRYSTNGSSWQSSYFEGAIYMQTFNSTTGLWGASVNLNSSPNANKLIWYVGSATVYDLSLYEDVVSQINMTPGEIKISAAKINLEGYVTASNISAIDIKTSRLTVYNGAMIGAFSVNSNTLYWSGGSAKIRLGYGGGDNFCILAQSEFWGNAIAGIAKLGGAGIYGSCRTYPTYPSTSVLWAGYFDGNVNVYNANLFCEGGVVQAKEVYSLNGWSGSFKGKSVRVKWGIITEVW